MDSDKRAYLITEEAHKELYQWAMKYIPNFVGMAMIYATDIPGHEAGIFSIGFTPEVTVKLVEEQLQVYKKRAATSKRSHIMVPPPKERGN